jgi:hypothetical protein
VRINANLNKIKMEVDWNPPIKIETQEETAETCGGNPQVEGPSIQAEAGKGNVRDSEPMERNLNLHTSQDFEPTETTGAAEAATDTEELAAGNPSTGSSQVTVN